MPKVPNVIGFQDLCDISVTKWWMNLIFWADKRQSFLQVDAIFFIGFGQAYPKYRDKYGITLQYIKKEFSWFCVCRWTWKFFIIWYCYIWLVWSSMLKVPKITNLQYLRNDVLDYLEFWYILVAMIISFKS